MPKIYQTLSESLFYDLYKHHGTYYLTSHLIHSTIVYEIRVPVCKHCSIYMYWRSSVYERVYQKMNFKERFVWMFLVGGGEGKYCAFCWKYRLSTLVPVYIACYIWYHLYSWLPHIIARYNEKQSAITNNNSELSIRRSDWLIDFIWLKKHLVFCAKSRKYQTREGTSTEWLRGRYLVNWIFIVNKLILGSVKWFRNLFKASQKRLNNVQLKQSNLVYKTQPRLTINMLMWFRVNEFYLLTMYAGSTSTG